MQDKRKFGALVFLVAVIVLGSWFYILPGDYLEGQSAINKISDTVLQATKRKQVSSTDLNSIFVLTNAAVNVSNREYDYLEGQSAINKISDTVLQATKRKQVSSTDLNSIFVLTNAAVNVSNREYDHLQDIKILVWTRFLKAPSKANCDLLPPGMNCFITGNRHDYKRSDAIMIHMREITRLSYLPQHRKSSQKWIFVENEPPTKAWSYLPAHDRNDVRGLFNITLTYTQDSSIAPSPLRCARNAPQYSKLSGVNFASGKTRDVAWFASHCDTPNKRENYVRELGKYIDVDIYGTCGPLKCASRSREDKAGKRDCDQNLLDGTYKFYLSFENSFCEDYYTEKLTRMLKINVIPVVMGYTNYSKILPPDSFIDVRDFASPRKLADYLRNVSDDDHLFNNYIRNRNSLNCKRSQSSKYCQVCSHLHKNRNRQEMIEDVVDFWSVDKKCVSNKLFFSKNHK